MIRCPKSLMTAVLAWGAAFSQEDYSNWAYYKAITVNTTNSGANVAGSVASFPVLVRLTSAQADVFSQAAAGGADIRFTDSSGAIRLKHENERWDSAGQAAEFWVLVPSVAGNANTTLRMYWGRNGAADSSDGGQVFPASNGFVSVWHMGNASGTSARPNAVTGAPSATPTNFPSGYQPKPGAVGLADSLRGGYMTTKDHLTIGSYAGFSDFTSGFTFSVWVYSTSNATLATNAPYWSSANGQNDRIIIGQNAAGATGVKFRFNVGTGNNIGILGGSGKIALNQWRHFVQTKEPGSGVLRVYINGVLDSSLTGLQDIPNVTRPNNYLGRSYAVADSNFAGKLDEARLSNVSRGADWARLSYETQKPGAAAVSLGSTQITASGPAITSHPQNVTVTAGGAVKLGVVATGTAPLVFKWVKNNTDTVGGLDTLTLNNVQAADDGATYKCVVRNNDGQAISLSATLTVLSPPVIVVQPPTFVSFSPGGFLAIGMKAAGSPPLTYKWVKNNTDTVPGANTDTLTFYPAQLSDSGSYKCVVRNVAGQAVSNAAMATRDHGDPVRFGTSPERFTVLASGTAIRFRFPEGLPETRISIVDVWGRAVWSRSVSPGTRELSWRGRGVPAGIYLLRISGRAGVLTEAKVTLTR